MNAISYRAINPAVLLQLAGDLATFRLLAQTFVDHAPEQFRQLVAALQQRDHAVIGRCCHTLKGMASLVGAERLAELLRSMEAAARRQSVTDAPELGQVFLQVLAEVTASLEDDGIGA
ncbi:Hpt domain-containing protein [Duganella callida]|uniref:Hpt domain-containing protein n=1 Tax=Duganella callida TaxID=2561932 RepID=UPI0014318868|nr:Hpt domain-containing protein [Duganella callida]